MFPLSDEDKSWLSEAQPGLNEETGGITGQIEFSATFDETSDMFLVLGAGVRDTIGGRRLTGRFHVTIREKVEGSISKLPHLYVDGVEAIPNRHFNQSDKAACLCSPLEEDAYLSQKLDVRTYIEHLVIPFLYGQVFYSGEGRWPWPEYEHGVLGLLESYLNVKNPQKAAECLVHLSSQGKADWSRIRSILKQQNIGGHTTCLCAQKDHMRRCHPKALAGLRLLSADVKNQQLNFPRG